MNIGGEFSCSLSYVMTRLRIPFGKLTSAKDLYSGPFEK
jgi:hypothetical protein